MNIQPLGKRVVISEIRSEEKTKSGIVLPESVQQEGSNMAQVLAVGSGIESELQVDDIIIFNRQTGAKLTLNNENYLIIDEKNILAISKI
jgi:chaperonin GroES